MTYPLCMNDDRGTLPWWINFCSDLHPCNDLAGELAKWKASIPTGILSGDKIYFETEEDKSWFLLRWT